jgi:hypothetical protein
MVNIKSGKQSNIWLTCCKEELYQLRYSIGIDKNVHGWIVFSTEDFTGSTGYMNSFFLHTLLIFDIKKITRDVEKHLINTHTGNMLCSHVRFCS